MTDSLNRRSACLALVSASALPSVAWASTAPGLEIGVLPNLSARVLIAMYQPLRDFLSRELRRSVQVSTAPNWSAFHQRTLALDYDVVVTAANLARVAQLEQGYLPVVSFAPDIKGLMVVAKARPMKTVAELSGQTLVLSNPQSLVTLRGMQWLAESGLQRGRDFNTISTPTDDSVGNVVARGDAVAAMLSGGEFRAIPDAVKAQLQTLTSFAEVPGFVVMASPRMPAAEVQRLKTQLLAFSSGSDEGKAFFASSGFTALRDVAPGVLESMDPFVEATRKSLTPTG